MPAVLTERETEILTLVARGRNNGQIGRELGISEDTVKTHLGRVYRRLEVTDRASAVAAAYQRGQLPMPPGSTPRILPSATGPVVGTFRTGPATGMRMEVDRSGTRFYDATGAQVTG